MTLWRISSPHKLAYWKNTLKKSHFKRNSFLLLSPSHIQEIKVPGGGELEGNNENDSIEVCHSDRQNKQRQPWNEALQGKTRSQEDVREYYTRGAQKCARSSNSIAE